MDRIVGTAFPPALTFQSVCLVAYSTTSGASVQFCSLSARDTDLAHLPGLVVSALPVYHLPMAERAARITTSFRVTSTHESRVLASGTAEVNMTGGGFGTVTFHSKDGKITATRPIYPRGHKLTEAEVIEMLQYEWPADWSFREFMILKLNEIAEAQKG